MFTTSFQRGATNLAYGVFIIAALTYFGYRAVWGNDGFFAQVSMDRDLRLLENELAIVSAERARLENLSDRLSERYLDLDLLDERVRDVLGYVRADEVVLR